jgi:hypothetical protein
MRAAVFFSRTRWMTTYPIFPKSPNNLRTQRISPSRRRTPPGMNNWK